MLTGSRRLIVLVGAMVALVVVGIGAFLVLPPRQSGDIAAPPADANPRQVVVAYLDALNAHDCDTAAAVMTEEAQDSGRAWCEDVGSLSDVEMGDPFTEHPRDSGHAAPAEVVDVPVTFDLDWRMFHSDPSMREGRTIWGFLLVRESPDSPWRIFDQGTG